MTARDDTAPRVLDRPPAALPMMLRAALPAVPVLNRAPGVRRSGSQLPGLAVTRHDVPIDRDHVAAYAEVCGFPLKEALPVTYPHVLAFPLHMAIMTDRSFPFPAIGTVHLENSITQHRAISADERLQLTARAVDLRPRGSARGRAARQRGSGPKPKSCAGVSTSTRLRARASGTQRASCARCGP